MHRAGLKNAEGEVEVVAVKVQHAWMSDHTSSDVTAMLWAAMAVDMAFTDVEVTFLLERFHSPDIKAAEKNSIDPVSCAEP